MNKEITIRTIQISQMLYMLHPSYETWILASI